LASSAYATTTDMTLYVQDLTQSSTTQLTTISAFLNASSRYVDEKTGQFFYDDGQYTQRFDGSGSYQIDTPYPFFFSSGTIGAVSKGATTASYTVSQLAPRPPANNDVFTLDVGSLQEQVTVSNVTGTGPYTLTFGATSFAHAASTLATTAQVQLAYFENQPLAQWTTQLSGDGVNPPSNFFAWPRNRRRVGAVNAQGGTADTTSRWPWYGIDIASIPISNTTYLPASIPGKLTVSLNVHWGWPVVPDAVRDVTCKIAARMWRARQAGWSEQLGTTDTGLVTMIGQLDKVDRYILELSDYNRKYWG
jgi:hypothetical protein